MANREGGSEWEPIKILSQKNSAYVPITTPRVTHDQAGAQSNLSRDLRNKAWKARKQSGSKHERARATKQKAESYRIILSLGSDHPLASRAGPGHPGTSSRITRPPSGHPGTWAGSPKTAQKNNPRNRLKLSIDGSPKPLGVLRRNFGEMMNTPRRGYAPKISVSNSLQLPESRNLAKNTMNLGSSENQ